jgi:hypothetical protein
VLKKDSIYLSENRIIAGFLNAKEGFSRDAVLRNEGSSRSKRRLCKVPQRIASEESLKWNRTPILVRFSRTPMFSCPMASHTLHRNT